MAAALAVLVAALAAPAAVVRALAVKVVREAGDSRPSKYRAVRRLLLWGITGACW